MKTDAERDKERYKEIVLKYNCIVKGELKSGARGRGVFATENIEEGEMVMEIPVEHCIWNTLNQEELGISTSGPDVTEEEKKKLAWASELKLTAELMSLLHKAAYEGSGFWAEYWWLLPAPDTKELPSNFPRGLLEQLSVSRADITAQASLPVSLISFLVPGYTPRPCLLRTTRP